MPARSCPAHRWTANLPTDYIKEESNNGDRFSVRFAAAQGASEPYHRTLYGRPADADETLRDAPLGEEVTRLSRLKAEAVQAQHPNAVCIGSDTMVTIDGLRLGKPKDADEAASMLRRLRGRTHEVLTGLAVLTPDGGAHTLHTCTRVTFRDFAEDELAAYLATREPLDKAGAYGIQGHGALLIKGIEGDYYSVMGLPVAPLYTILRDIHAV